MSNEKTDLQKLLENKDFPLSNKYDPQWVVDNQMGPNALWLTEWLCRDMDLTQGMRVLDMGCGRCLSSVFLAREFGVQVWASDLWVSATDNWKRICEAGLEDQIFPIHAEAHSLPYAHEFFDAIVCVDSYIYYGTDDLYLNYFHKFVRRRGQIGIVVPGLTQDLDGPVPEHLKPFWGQDCWSWHTVEWWRHLWDRTGLVDVELGEPMLHGCHVYWQWKKALNEVGANRWPAEEVKVLEADDGRYMGFVRMIARRNQPDRTE